MARDAPSCRLVVISVDCLGLSLPIGLPASVNSPLLCRFSHSVLNGCRFSISVWVCKCCCMGIQVHLTRKYVTAHDNWYQAFPLAFSPRLRDKTWGGKDWERGYSLIGRTPSQPHTL